MKISWVWVGQDFLQKTQEILKQINKLDFIKTKNFYSSKGTPKKMKRQTMDWKEVWWEYIAMRTLPVTLVGV